MKRLLLSCCLVLAATFTLFAQPANDDCGSAISFVLDEVVSFTTVDATTDGVTHPSCLGANDSIPADVWYTFTAAEEIPVIWTNCGTADYDSRVAVYATDDPCMATDINLVACNDDGSDAACDEFFTSTVVFLAEAGQTYTFRVGGFAGDDGIISTGSGTFTLSEFESAVANDLCALAIPLELGAGQSFSTLGATTDGPNHPDNADCFGFGSITAGQDIWYTYTADFTGTVFWNFCGTIDYDSRIVVYGPGASCTPSAEDLYACNDDGTESSSCASPNFHSDLFFDVVNGESYLLRVGGFGSDAGDGTFDFLAEDRPPAPTNDLCDDAIAMDVVSFIEADDGDGFVAGTTVSSTIDEENFLAPACTNDQGTFADVWYSFESNGNTEVRVDLTGTDGSGADFVLDLWTDCGVRLDTTGTNNCVTADDDNPFATETITGLPADQNVTIFVRILTYTTFSPTGPFAVQVSAASPSAIRELDEVENLTLYPNPVQDLATVDFSLREALDLELEIFDLFGRSIENHQLGRMTAGLQRYSFDTSNLPAGMYTVLLSNGRAAQQMKMVVR